MTRGPHDFLMLCRRNIRHFADRRKMREREGRHELAAQCAQYEKYWRDREFALTQKSK